MACSEAISASKCCDNSVIFQQPYGSTIARCTPGWNRRSLPDVSIANNSEKGKRLFCEALLAGGLRGYFSLADTFHTQSELSYCGPATLSMVLNSLNIDPGHLWKGNWRFFDEGILRTCDKRKLKEAPLLGVIEQGLTFEEFLFLTECNGGSIIPFPASHVSLAQFRSAILVACTRSYDDIRLVCNYDRDTLHQTGSGHYSPIAGYHAEEDLVLVLDVARFKYSSYWISVELLWQSMNVIDPLTNESRGYYLITKWPTDFSVECMTGSCTVFQEQPTDKKHPCSHGTSLLFSDGANIFPAFSPKETPTIEATIITALQSLPLLAVQLVTKWTFDVMQKYRLAALSVLKCARHDVPTNLFQSYVSFLPGKVENLLINDNIACKTPCTRLIQSHIHAYAIPTKCALEPFIHLFDSDVDGRLYRVLERMQIEQYLTINPKGKSLYLFGALSLLEDTDSKKVDIERGLTTILLYALLTPRFLSKIDFFDSSDLSRALKDEVTYARASLGLS